MANGSSGGGGSQGSQNTGALLVTAANIGQLIRNDRLAKKIERFNDAQFRKSVNILERSASDNIGQLLKRLNQQREAASV